MDNEILKILIEKFYSYRNRKWRDATKRNYRYCFDGLLAFLGKKQFNRDNVEAFLNTLERSGKAVTTQIQFETYIKSFVTWLYEDQKAIEENWGKKIARTKVHHKTYPLPGIEEMLELICKATEPGQNDHKQHRFSKLEHRSGLSFMLIAGGTRNRETREMLREDVSISGGYVVMRSAKGGNSKPVAIPNVPWLINDLKKRVAGRTPEELEMLSDRTHYKPEDIKRLFVINQTKLQETMRKAGQLWGHPLKVHDLRRIFARDLDENGAPDRDIMRTMRHSNIQTTLRYLEDSPAVSKRTLKNYSTVVKKYRTREEKKLELVTRAMEIGMLQEAHDEGDILIIQVRIN